MAILKYKTANGYQPVAALSTIIRTVTGLDSIQVTTPPTTTQYNVGNLFNPQGMIVKANYTNGAYNPNATYTYETRPLTAEDTYMTITKSEGGDIVTTTTPIAVKNAGTPAKGALITMELGNREPISGTNNVYRVLRVNGDIALVVAMFDMRIVQFNEYASDRYEGKNLDTYLNTTWYNSLSSYAKEAIVSTSITQDSWYGYDSGEPVYSGTSTYTNYNLGLNTASYRAIGDRYVFALSVQDIIDYLGAAPSMSFDNTTITESNLWTMFYNTSTAPSTGYDFWLRSASVDQYPHYPFYISKYNGCFDDNHAAESFVCAARPALRIDLTKIPWSNV